MMEGEAGGVGWRRSGQRASEGRDADGGDGRERERESKKFYDAS